MIQFGKERCCSNEKIIIDSFLESTNKLIIEKLQKNQINKPGLYSGMLGDLLFCRYYAELYSKELTLYESVENIVLTEVFRVIDSDKILLIIQLGIALQIMQIEFREDNNIEKILHAIDVTLEKHVLNSSKRNKYDFFSGLSTIGLYFYLRESKPQQGLFMNQLFADFKSKNFIIDNNPGVAHGWGSAFLLSLKIAQKNHKVKSAYYDFFNDMQKMVLRKVQDENNIFQSRTGHKIRTTSWCKGMLPICLALEKSYELCSDSLSCFEPRKLAKNIINYSISIENYDDPCLCHGTASIAMLCGQFLPIPYYTDAATKACDKWNGALISQLETTNNKSISFYKDYSGLLLGKSGIGLFLISLINPEKRKWLELLLLE